MKLNHVSAIFLSGVLWLAMGTYLLMLGIHFIIQTAQSAPGGTRSLITVFSPLAGNREQAALLLIVLGLFLGFIKGRYILAKTVRRVVYRITSLAPPLTLTRIYGIRYLALLGIMAALGMGLKWFAVPLEVRGLIDVAIGSALIQGALVYFRQGYAIRKGPNSS